MESLESNQINIKDLATNIPKKPEQFYFDPIKEITEEDLRHFEEYFQKEEAFRVDPNRADAFATIFPQSSAPVAEENPFFINHFFTRGLVRQLLPGFRALSNTRFTQGQWTDLQALLERKKDAHEWQDYLRLLLTIKLNDVEKFHTLTIDPTIISDCFTPTTSFESKIEIQISWKWVFPAIPFPVAINADQHNGEWNDLEQRFYDPIKYGPSYLLNFPEVTRAMTALHAKVLYPERFEEFPITRDHYKIFYAMLRESHEKGKWEDFFNSAFFLSVLSAQKIIVDEEGLHIVNPQPRADLQQDIPSMPEIKKF